MSWNYRVVRIAQPDGERYYEIREAYYKTPNDTLPWAITANGARPGGSTLLELRKDLTLMLEAINRGAFDESAIAATAEPMSADAVDPAEGIVTE